MRMNFRSRWNNIAYMWSNGLLETLPESFTDKISPKLIHKKYLLIMKDFLADLLRVFRKTKIPSSKIWFLVLTQNNVDALKGIKEKTEGSIFVSFYRFRSTINVNTHYFYLSRRFFHDFLYPFTWFLYFLKYRKKATRFFDLFFSVNGTYKECLRLLKKNRPEAIVFTNDHLVIARSLLLAANKLGIKTYYVQHASVTAYFPPLEFTYALLDGKDALSKYEECGDVISKVHLVGICKFDNYVNQLNNSTKVRVLGIAFNLIDEIDDVRYFVDELRKEHLELELVLRPHPADNRDLSSIKGVSISNRSKENTFEFIKRIDCLISGDSSIHLEAILLNVNSLYYNFGISKRFDFYGYVKNGLIVYYPDLESINKKVNELKAIKTDVHYKASYYNAAIGTDFYGKTTKKISDIILDTVKEGDD